MINYHGKTPVTQSDITMAKKHLKDTLTIKKKELALNKSKIADHQQAVTSTDNPQSISYNKGHIAGHVKDNKAIKATIAEREASMNTVNNLKPVYDKGQTMTPTPKAPNVSKGFAGFLAKKKVGAKTIANKAASAAKSY